MTSSAAMPSSDCGLAETLIAARAARAIGAESEAVLAAHLAHCPGCLRVTRELEARSGPPAWPDGMIDVDVDVDVDALPVIESEAYVRGAEIGRGGMGRVLRAYDRRLGRVVAIKQLLDARLAERFEHEARLTARLQHPAIVTIYEAGRWPSGEPFYAMKYVAGRPLDAVIAGLDTLDARLGLLAHLTTVVEAIAYAHSEQIVHRDLKPHNILVGPFGETVIIDWGLAKDLRAVDAPDAPATNAGGPLTRGGAGTPAYMAPEQARGEPPDERVDVYALGATLHHLLAGDRPDQRPLPAATPPDLRAIVARAMAERPGDRYPTAAELAAELRRFQNGQLVASHRYTAGELARRWLRRHRASALVAAGALIVLAAGGALGVHRIIVERDRANREKTVAEAARAAADAQRQGAEHLVDFMLGTLHDRLEPIGKLELLAGVGHEVEGYLAAVHDDAADAPSLRRRATAIGILFGAELRKQNYDVAGALGRRGAGAYQRLLAATPDDTEARAELAMIETGLASILVKKGQRHEGLEAYRRAAATAAETVQHAPHDPRARTMQALADASLALTASGNGDAEGARAAGAAARADLAGVNVAALPPRWASRYATALCTAGNVQQRARDLDAAARTLGACVDVRRTLAAAQPASGEYQYALAVALRNLAFVDDAQGRAPASRDALAAAVDVLRPLVAAEPDHAEWARELATAEPFLCQAELVLGHTAAAALACRRGVDLARHLAAAHPDDSSAAQDLVRALRHTGESARVAGRPADALVALDEAHALAVRFVAREPLSRMWSSNLVDLLHVRAMVQLALGRLDAAQRDADAAIDLQRRRVAAAPGDAQLTASLADKLVLRGDLARARHDLDGARRAYAEARSSAGQALALGPTDSEAAFLLARAEIDLAEVRELQGGHDEAAPLLRRAIDRLAAMGPRGELDPDRRTWLARAHRDAAGAPRPTR